MRSIQLDWPTPSTQSTAHEASNQANHFKSFLLIDVGIELLLQTPFCLGLSER